MNAIRISRKLESTTPHLPELAALVGKRVEFIVLEEPGRLEAPSNYASTEKSLRGSVLRDDDPFGPAVPAGDWEALG